MPEPLNIPIVVAFNQNYCLPAGVALHSMLTHAAHTHENTPLFYKIHCLVQGVDATHKAKLEQGLASFRDFSSVEFIDIESATSHKPQATSHKPQATSHKPQATSHSVAEKFNILFKSLSPFAQKRFSPLILTRFILPSLFPQYDKIIMCDVDVVFAGDISGSYFMLDIESRYCLAVAKEVRETQNVADLIKTRQISMVAENMPLHILTHRQWQILHDHPFNIGFAVYNLKAWRTHDIEDHCVAFFTKNGHGLYCPEQDTLTLLCYQNILELPHTYNANPHHFQLENHPIRQTIKDPQEVIMWHFYGPDKPWNPESFHAAQFWIAALLRTTLAPVYFENYYSWLKDHNFKNHFIRLESLITKKFLAGYVFYKIQRIVKRSWIKFCLWWKLKRLS
ncbi:glycosyltransferase family 8 protein [Helicobacter ailurogastricus]|uniref:glycosyltransferase family 8 protein n=1 Tax=Helicobacter ailurogastricus TaxID=1578720 RepID=UPI000CF04E1F|nr:glycosyltransferase [Helicobacter ailurogastricus]